MLNKIFLSLISIISFSNINCQLIYQKHFSLFNQVQFSASSTQSLWDSTITYCGVAYQSNSFRKPYLYNVVNNIKHEYSANNFYLNSFNNIDSYENGIKKGYVATGYVRETLSNKRKVIVMKFDEIGNPLKENHIEYIGSNSSTEDIMCLPNGNTILLSKHSSGIDSKLTVTLLDPSLSVIWARNLSDSFLHFGGSLKMKDVGNGKVFITGNVTLSNSSSYGGHIFISEINYTSGAISYFKTYHRSNIHFNVGDVTIRGKNTKNTEYIIVGTYVEGVPQNNINRKGFVLILNNNHSINNFKVYSEIDTNYYTIFRTIKYDISTDEYVIAGERIDLQSTVFNQDAISLKINALNYHFINGNYYGLDTLTGETFSKIHLLNDSYIFSGGRRISNSTTSEIYEVKTLKNLESGCNENTLNLVSNSYRLYQRVPKYRISSANYVQNTYNYQKELIPFKEYIDCKKTVPTSIYNQNFIPKKNSSTSFNVNEINNYLIYDIQGRKVNSRIEDLPAYTLYLIHDLENNKIIKLIKHETSN